MFFAEIFDNIHKLQYIDELMAYNVNILKNHSNALCYWVLNAMLKHLE